MGSEGLGKASQTRLSTASRKEISKSMKCSRNDKQFRTAELHGLGRSIGAAGDEAGRGASKHHVINVLECHAQTSSYVQASEEI